MSEDLRPLLAQLPDSELKSKVSFLAASERKITAQIVSYIAEIDRRKSYLRWGYPSLFEFLTVELKYSAAAAYRRIQAARALVSAPNLLANLENGALKLSQVAAVQTALRRLEKSSGRRVGINKVREVYLQIEQKTTFETEQIIKQQLGDGELDDKTVQLTLRLSEETFKKLQRAKELLSHKDPGADWGRVLDMVLEDSLNKRDLMREKKSTSASEVKPSRSKTSRRKAIPKSVRKLVLRRDHGRCQYKSADGKVCGSQFLVEIDHVRPVSWGGGNEIKNLRVFCRGHNQMAHREFEGANSIDHPV